MCSFCRHFAYILLARSSNNNSSVFKKKDWLPSTTWHFMEQSGVWYSEKDLISCCPQKRFYESYNAPLSVAKKATTLNNTTQLIISTDNIKTIFNEENTHTYFTFLHHSSKWHTECQLNVIIEEIVFSLSPFFYCFERHFY